jgi:hypothetical protein
MSSSSAPSLSSLAPGNTSINGQLASMISLEDLVLIAENLMPATGKRSARARPLYPDTAAALHAIFGNLNSRGITTPLVDGLYTLQVHSSGSVTFPDVVITPPPTQQGDDQVSTPSLSQQESQASQQESHALAAPQTLAFSQQSLSSPQEFPPATNHLLPSVTSVPQSQLPAPSPIQQASPVSAASVSGQLSISQCGSSDVNAAVTAPSTISSGAKAARMPTYDIGQKVYGLPENRSVSSFPLSPPHCYSLGFPIYAYISCYVSSYPYPPHTMLLSSFSFFSFSPVHVILFSWCSVGTSFRGVAEIDTGPVDH